ncbi:hypothetical protein SSIM_11800 [Staphylococcus simulans UMC-CNS-990]|uniref:Uncharacterized protein n=1 Tax=Staphylococcus simulans UMC-CNS-990 TaxID=1405498 RepID=A0ABP2YSD9_STASI|nr:hypothetical protein SSIM_11800 [Staphylococcus simulans UMC-CNS-990]
MFISEIVHTKDSFLLKLYYKFNFATEPLKKCLSQTALDQDTSIKAFVDNVLNEFLEKSY